MPATSRQLLFRRIYDAVQVTSYHSDQRLVPGLGVAQSQEIKQGPNMVFIAMGVLAAKAPHRIPFVRFKICRTRVQRVGMLLHPRASYVMLIGTEWRLVKPFRFERRDDRVLRRLGCQNIVGIVAKGVRGIIKVRGGFRVFLRSSGGREFQLQPVDDLFWLIAGVGPPFDQATLKRRTGVVGMFLLTVDRHRQSCPSVQRSGRSCVA
jgi:hypothetical protein